jgi:hypothetical protein
MIGEPPGSLLRLQSWPYWMPNTLGQLPLLALPNKPATTRHEFFGPNAAAAYLPSASAGNPLTWLDQAASSLGSAGILGSLTRSLPSDSQPPLSGTAGILAPLGRASGVRGESAPAWLQSVSQWSGQSEPVTWDPWATPAASAPASGSPSAPEGANGSSLPQDFAVYPPLDEFSSDADIHELIPGARYAQMGPRRGGVRPGGRELSPAESVRLLLHANAHRTLRELDPNNPQLKSLSSPTWVPSQSDIARLHEEIARVRRERGLRELEVHHTLPREFERQFGEAGINPEHYKTYLLRDQHRLLPKGLHTGTDNWNAQWRRLFSQLPTPKQKQILKLLNEMLKRLSR